MTETNNVIGLYNFDKLIDGKIEDGKAVYKMFKRAFDNMMLQIGNNLSKGMENEKDMKAGHISIPFHINGKNNGVFDCFYSLFKINGEYTLILSSFIKINNLILTVRLTDYLSLSYIQDSIDILVNVGPYPIISRKNFKSFTITQEG